MTNLISYISGTNYQDTYVSSSNYMSAITAFGRTFLNTLYVCDMDIVYNNPSVDITEAWLLNNSAYIHKFDDDSIIDFRLHEESCDSNTFNLGSVISQQLTIRLERNDDYLNNCTTPDSGYENYFDNKCLIAFNRVSYGEDAWYSVPLGVFYVNSISGNRILELKCYDKMLQLDKKMNFQHLTYDEICEKMISLYKVVTTPIIYDEPTGFTDIFEPGITYREFLENSLSVYVGFVCFDRYGKLTRRLHYENSDINITGDYVLQNNIDELTKKRSYQVLSIDDKSTINNGYPIQVKKSVFFTSERYLEMLAARNSTYHDFTPCQLRLYGFPHFTVGDIFKVTLQDVEYNPNTYENEYVDREPFYCRIDSQDITFGGGISQTVTCFDVDTTDTKIASSNRSLDIPNASGILSTVFGTEKFEFSSAPAVMSKNIDVDIKAYNQSPVPEYRKYCVLAATKATRPSKAFPPSVDFSQISSGITKLYAYCNANTTVNYSWVGLDFIAITDLLQGAYRTQDYLLADSYEEYHSSSKGYINIDDFIIEWGILNVKEPSSLGTNEYYADIMFTKKYASEPSVLLMPSSRAAGTIQSYSYHKISDDVDITQGMRVYTYDTNIPAAGRDIQWIVMGRSENV